MPFIRQIGRQVTAPGPVGGPRMSAQAVGAPGRAAQQMGAAIAGVGQTLFEIEEKQSMWEAELQFSEAESAFTAQYSKAKEEAPADGKGFTEKMQEDYETFVSKAMENAPDSPRAQQLLTAKFARKKGAVLQDALSFQSRRSAEYQVIRTEKAMDNHSNTVRADPTQLPDTIQQQSELILNMNVPENIKDKLIIGGAQKLHDSALDGLVTQYEKGPVTVTEVDQLIGELKSGQRGYKKGSSPEMYDAALTRLENRRKSIEAGTKATLGTDMADTLASIGAGNGDPGLVTKDRLVSLYPDKPEVVARNLQQIQSAKDLHSYSQKMVFTTPAEDAEQEEALQAKIAGRGAAFEARNKAAYQQARAQKQKAIQTDSAAYVLRADPQLAEDYIKAQQSGDVEDFASVLGRMDTLQEQIGVPAHRRQYLGNGAAKEAVARLNAAAPEQAADQMEFLSNQYGGKYPHVMKELQKAGLDGSYQVLARLDGIEDVTTRKNLASALKSGRAELVKPLQGTDISDTDRELKDLFGDFQGSFNQAGATGANIVANELGAAQLLAYSYVGKGESPADAAEKAYSDLIGNRFDFQEGYRAPKGTGDIAQLHTQTMLRDLRQEQFLPIAVGPYTDPGMDTPDTEAYRQGVAYRRAKNEGIWVNNEDSSGVVLMVPDDTTGNGYSPLVLKDGSRVERTFQEMQEIHIPTFEEQRRGLY